VESEQGWLDWYRTLTVVQQHALDAYMSTQDLRYIPLLWRCLPTYKGQPMPAHVEWIFMVWYKSLGRVYQLALNAYFNANDDRLLLFVWDHLFMMDWTTAQHNLKQAQPIKR
jgi:hypothetical protein